MARRVGRKIAGAIIGYVAVMLLAAGWVDGHWWGWVGGVVVSVVAVVVWPSWKTSRLDYIAR